MAESARTLMIAVDVTDLTFAERDALVFEMTVQCEASEGHPDAPVLWTETIDGAVPRPTTDI